MLQNKKEVLTTIKENRGRIRELGVKRLGLFGSFVREEQNAQSDIDLLVEFDKDQKTFDNFIHLAFLLEKLFKRHVELVTAESLSPYIKPHITSEVEYVVFSS